MQKPEMKRLDLQQFAEKMRHLDIATMVTKAENGTLAGRPMSNNGDVDFDGKSYYFTYEQSDKVGQIGRDPQVQLAFEGDDQLYVTVNGKAELIRDKEQFKAHWTPELEQWFDQGVDTPGMVLICVRATGAKYWQDMEMGEWRA